jgi:hypothetical protein
MNTLSRTKTIVIMLLAAALTLATADTLGIALTSTSAAYISNDTVGRLLVMPSFSAKVAGARIDFALLTIPVRIPDSIGRVTFDVRAVTTAYDPSNVSWSYPWHTPGGGGDYDSTQQSLYTLLPGDTTSVRLDVTRYIRDGDTLGLLFKRPRYEGGGFGSEGALLRKAIRKARLKIYYMKVDK